MSRLHEEFHDDDSDQEETVPLQSSNNHRSESAAAGGDSTTPPQATATRSIYALTRKEISAGVANRIVHSRAYIFLYLIMAALSVTTVILGLSEGCPGVASYILEIIINASMIAEVAIRFVAFGRQFWKSAFNILDLILTFFCLLTLLVLIFAGCGTTSKEEEILDTLLLVARNVLQFVRLAAVMRHSGQSIFARPKPIDLSAAANSAGYGIDLDLDDEDEEDDDDVEHGRRHHNDEVLFDATAAQSGSSRPPVVPPAENVWS